MYKIIVVDDEAIIREGVRKIIDWDSVGFDCVAAFEDGEQAAKALATLDVDVVLTDIYMPFMDGLELADYIYCNHPNIKTVILTGYDDFEYAQTALKLKVADYILKPVTPQDIKDILMRIKDELDDQRQRQAKLARLETMLFENRPVILGRLLYRFVTGAIGNENIKRKLSYFDIEFSGKSHLAAIIDVDSGFKPMGGSFSLGAQGELLCFAVYNISEEIVGETGAGKVFQNPDEQTIILFSDDTDSKSIAQTICEKIRRIVETDLEFTVTIGLGRERGKMEELALSYADAQNALEHRFITGGNQVISFDELKITSERFLQYKEIEAALLTAVKRGDSGAIETIVVDTLAKIKASAISVGHCYVIVQRIVLALLELFYELDIDESQVFDSGEHIAMGVYRYKTLDEIQPWLCKTLQRAGEYLLGNANTSKAITQSAELYIKANFEAPDISINAVCKHLSISVSYFSAIFKNDTGETFIEYLTRLRMEKAMELLTLTSLKTYEIAFKVGYSDPHYFGTVFKKFTGCTPTTFRDSRSKDEKD